MACARHSRCWIENYTGIVNLGQEAKKSLVVGFLSGVRGRTRLLSTLPSACLPSSPSPFLKMDVKKWAPFVYVKTKRNGYMPTFGVCCSFQC